MLPEGAISAQHLWKRFRRDRRRMLIRDELEYVLHRVRRRTVDRHRWALRDVDFVVSPGEAVGLVGANGSGKSTLLKILTGVMYPYAGRLQVRGRVGALIEVRAGIHPDLTGRENVYLYGGLLGLGRTTVAQRFDEIVEFAELRDAIDRQVKFYSTGMQMRLGFAVAAFLEPDILLVDEVLSVGDAPFQQRCLDRMRAVLAQGTTLVFVSHDIAAVQAVCKRGVWLNRGVVEADGPVADVLSGYRASIEEVAEAGTRTDGLIRLVGADVSGNGTGIPLTDGPLEVNLRIQSAESRVGRLYVGASEGPATPIFLVGRDLTLSEGVTDVQCSIEHLPLPRGRFYMWAGAFGTHYSELLPWQPIASIDVQGPSLDPTPPAVVRLAPVHVEAGWTSSTEQP